MRSCVHGGSDTIASSTFKTLGGLSSTAATSFVNSATSQTELDINGAGSFAQRIEDNTLGLKLRPSQQFALITYLSNEGDSNYHTAEFTVRRRFSSGLGLSMAYTFGKSIDNQSVDPVGASSGGGLSTTTSRAESITAGRNAQLEYVGVRKVEDQTLHELRYLPHGGSDLKIKLLFEQDKFRHVQTEFDRVIAAPTGTRDYGNVQETETRYHMVE
ncbi:MAG TPA: hypothetical protein VK582_12035 [Pyrinomonadaceae bacterium]|nr:hypothetical protein [Pyrinomonadaceae bacterium]